MRSRAAGMDEMCREKLKCWVISLRAVTNTGFGTRDPFCKPDKPVKKALSQLPHGRVVIGTSWNAGSGVKSCMANMNDNNYNNLTLPGQCQGQQIDEAALKDKNSMKELYTSYTVTALN